MGVFRGLSDDGGVDAGSLLPLVTWAAAWIAVGAWGVRILSLRVEAGPDGILVVNYLRQHRLGWDEIDSFRVGNEYWGIEASCATEDGS
jgi:hypothetical protein